MKSMPKDQIRANPSINDRKEAIKNRVELPTVLMVNRPLKIHINNSVSFVYSMKHEDAKPADTNVQDSIENELQTW